MSCELCSLSTRVYGGGLVEEKIVYKDSSFFVVFCNNPDHPGTPMVVLRRHEVEASQGVLEQVYNVMFMIFPERRAREEGMLTIKNHWHEHWTLKRWGR